MEENKQGMEIFSDGPVIDLSGNEDIDYLFKDSEELADTEQEQEEDPVIEENDETITNEDDQETDDSESVVGEDTEDDAEENDSDADTDAGESSSNSNLFNSLTALLSEKGLISSTDSDLNVETEEQFIELFQKQIKSSEYADLNDNQKYYLENLREGIPHQKIINDLETLDGLNSLNEDTIKEDSNLRQRIIYQDLINKGFTEARAKKNLQRSIELEQDTEDALEALESIRGYNSEKIAKENEAIKAESLQRKQAEENRIKSIKDKIKESDEVIKNFKITDSVKQNIEKNMFEVVGTNPSTNQSENSLMKHRRENPIDFDYKLYYLYTITNGFKNFDTLTKNTNSRVLKDLEKAVKSTTKIKDPGSPAYLQDPESYDIDIAGHEVVVD